MNDDLKREQLLHKIIAASGFVFALLILPIAQHFLIQGQAEPTTGTVAGVSTDKTITNADIPNTLSPTACEAQKQKDLTDLQTFYDGKKQALLRSYQASVQSYQDAETNGGLSDTDKAALDQLIKNQYDPYIQSLNQVQAAVNNAQNEITIRDCGAASSTPAQ